MLGIVNEHIKFEARMLAGEPAAAGSTLAAFPRLLLLLVLHLSIPALPCGRSAALPPHARAHTHAHSHAYARWPRAGG